MSGARGQSLVRGLSLAGVVALVVGNMVGTSIYTLPASLAAAVGPMGIVAWLLTAVGYLGVALVYASLGTRFPRTGGPYVYAREAFGDFAGFETVWLYWLSAVLGNAGITIGVIGYVEGLIPTLAASVPLKFALGQAMLWGLCWLNVRGVKGSARLQIAIMLMNIVPLLGLTMWSARAFDPGNLRPFAPKGWSSLAAGAALIVWAYSGVESATVPAEEVRSPERMISRGTLIGYAIATLVFVSTSIIVAGVLPNAVVASSARPIAMAVGRGVGPWAAVVISVGAIVAGTGTLNGWMLMSGRIPVSAAEDGLFFAALSRIHPRFRTPHVALVVGTAVASATLLLMFNHTLLDAFDFIVLLTVWLTLVPHLFAAAAELALARRDRDQYTPAQRRRAQVFGSLAFVAV
ncbi:MAG TPA: amino acid permease, partial [Gemmatimonadaceae bacterium]|nr:amino acid permease [Gemmatimonadaceae bacterium]